MHDLSLPQEHLHAAPHWVHWQADPRSLTLAQTFAVFGDGVRHLFQSAVFHMPVALGLALVYAITGGLLGATIGRIPVIGPFLVVPVLVALFSLALAGWLRATHRLAHQRMRDEAIDYRAALHDLVSGFKEQPVRLAAYALVLWLSAMVVAVGVTALAAYALGATDTSSTVVGSSLSAVFLGLVVACVLSPLAAWQILFLAQASVTRLSLNDAVKSAARAVQRNVLSLMALGAIIIVAAALVGGFSGFVAGGLGALTRSRWVSVLCFAPAALLFSSIGPAMTYALAQRLYDRQAPASEPSTTRPPTATVLPDASNFRAAPVSRDDPWTLSLLRAIDALRFGEMCMMYFRIAGFAVQSRPSLSDGAARFTLAPEALPDKPVMLVDALAWGQPSDLSRIRHFRQSMQRAQLDRGTMVAASGFSPEAIHEAKFAKIRLIDGAELLTLILKLSADQQQVLREMAFPDTPPTL